MKNSELNEKQQAIYEESFSAAIDEGVAIERKRVLELLKEYNTSPGFSWELLREQIENIELPVDQDLPDDEAGIREAAAIDGINEGRAIELIRVSGLLDDYLEEEDVDFDLLLEWIEEV